MKGHLQLSEPIAAESAATAAEPSLRYLQGALRRTTECLARGLVRADLRAGEDPPLWSATEWRIARAAAAIHGITAILAERLPWRGPPGWTRFLASQKTHTAQRWVRIAGLLERIDAQARAAGIGLIALKGAALYADGLYASGERPMGDIDLFARPDDSERATEVLAALGYRELYHTWKHRVFATPEASTAAALGEHPGNTIHIDLHTHLKEILPLRPVDLTGLLARQPDSAGLSGYPSLCAALKHVLLHASGTMIFRSLRMIHLEDIARLCARMTQADWTQALRAGDAGDEPHLWWAYPPLLLADRYYGCVPRHVLAETASGCGWLLKRAFRQRTVTDVSLSHMWVSAFPGIEWARSAGEMLSYMAERVAPGAEALRMREQFATLQPRVSGGSWSELSQARRILHWLSSPQPRQESVQPVRAALASWD